MRPSWNNTASSEATAKAAKWAVWIVLAFLPVGLLALFAFRTASHSVRESIQANNFAAAVVAADIIETDLRRSLALTTSLAESPTFVDAVRDRDVEAVRARLRSALLLYPAIDRAFVHDADGVLWSDFPPAPESLGHSFADREWYAGVSQAWEPYVSTVYTRHAAPQVLVVAVAVPVRHENGVVGILVIQHRLDSLSEALSHVRWGEMGGAFLLDPNGAVAGHPEFNLQYRLYTEYADLAPVRRALRGTPYTGEFSDPLTDDLTVATFYPVEITNRNWVVVTNQPAHQAYAPIRRIAWNIGGAGAFLALAAAAVVMALWRVNENNRRLNTKLEERSQALNERTARLRGLAAQLTSAEQRERKRLAALLHDDLQQLLAAANMRLSSAIRRVEDESIKEMLADVGEWIDRATTSARDLTYELRPPALYEAGLLDALHWLASRMWERHHLHVDIASAASLQPLRDDSKALLFDCVRELLFNVAKHAGVDRAIVTLAEENDALTVTVEDRGRGFDIKTETRETHDQGFGLFSIRERLLALGGDMRIQTRIDHGTRTKLILPLTAIVAGAPQEAQEDKGEAPVPGTEEEAERNGSPAVRVLVVDDHAIVRQGIANVLNKDERIRVVGEAGDGLEAIEAVSQKRPNVVLMDLNMPRMNGIDATREIQRRWPETGVIGLSVQDDPTTAQSMLAAGAKAFLSKSGDADRMIATIVNLKKNHEAPPPAA